MPVFISNSYFSVINLKRKCFTTALICCSFPRSSLPETVLVIEMICGVYTDRKFYFCKPTFSAYDASATHFLTRFIHTYFFFFFFFRRVQARSRSRDARTHSAKVLQLVPSSDLKNWELVLSSPHYG